MLRSCWDKVTDLGWIRSADYVSQGRVATATLRVIFSMLFPILIGYQRNNGQLGIYKIDQERIVPENHTKGE